MANKSDSNKDSVTNPLDLSQLSDLSFGPDWASGTTKKRSEESYRNHDGEDRRPSRRGSRPGGGQRDRRGDGNRDRRGNTGGRRDSRDGRRFEGRPRAPFEPPYDVIFVSQDKPFEVLLKAMRTTYKTYELFEIARIVLGKENRFVAIVTPKPESEEKKIYISVPDQLPFQSRDEAINHVMNHHLERFFEISEVEVEPPAGNFQMVNRCKLTGELLAPPNFHRYQDILKEHYTKHISNLSFERFVERVESVKDPEIVQEWINKMKVTRQYTLKQKESDESPKVVLSALEDVRYYLTTERKNEIFVAKDKVRLPGEKIETLPRGVLRRSIERELDMQRRFPLITSNHLRGRLRRCNLNFFKKGSKGITYVCAVKRKPRYKDTVFSESIQALIEHIEANPRIKVEDLLNTYLPKGMEEVSDDSKKAVSQDLRWLIGAGYVSEFGNAELLAEKTLDILAAEDKNNQPSPSESNKSGKSRGKKKAQSTEASPAAVEESTEEVVDSAPVEEVAAEVSGNTSVAEESTPEAEEAVSEAPVAEEEVVGEAVESESVVEEVASAVEEAKPEEVVAEAPAAEEVPVREVAEAVESEPVVEEVAPVSEEPVVEEGTEKDQKA